MKYRSLRGDLIEVFKRVKGQDDGYLKDVFEMKGPGRSRGHPHQLVMKHSRTRLRQSFFSGRVVGYCDRLPAEVVLADSLVISKHRLDRYYIQKGWAYQYVWD